MRWTVVNVERISWCSCTCMSLSQSPLACMKDDADSVRGYGVYLRQLGIPSEFGEAIACRSQVASGAAGQKPNLSRDPGHVFWPCVPFDVLTCDTTSC